jgi:hypothetical protein
VEVPEREAEASFGADPGVVQALDDRRDEERRSDPGWAGAVRDRGPRLTPEEEEREARRAAACAAHFDVASRMRFVSSR